jgi:NAD(P)-dependent dehydrogenase (short-subunit alcohol dehydrogenase family)
MKNKICVITGCNTGIGKATAIALAAQGFEIVMLVRESEKSRLAFEEIKAASKSAKAHLYFVELSSLSSISETAERLMADFTQIDVLINNAGVYKRREEKSADGFEMTFAVNYLATFSLTNALLPLLRKSSSARVINLSSELYKRGKVNPDQLIKTGKFNGDQAYADAKLLVIYFTMELAARLKTDIITVNAVHPGVVGTDVFRDYPGWFAGLLKLFISKPETGAKPSVYLASSATVSGITGKYFKKTKMVDLPDIENDKELLKTVWDNTYELIKGKI